MTLAQDIGENLAAMNNSHELQTRFEESFEHATRDGRLFGRLGRRDRVTLRGALRHRREEMQAEAIDQLVAESKLGEGSKVGDIKPPEGGTIDWAEIIELIMTILPIIARFL